MKPQNDLRDRTKRHALQIIRIFTRLPNTAEAQVVGEQALHSGTSAGANNGRHFAAAAALNSQPKPAAAVSKNSKKLHTGWNCLRGAVLLTKSGSLICRKNAMS